MPAVAAEAPIKARPPVVVYNVARTDSLRKDNLVLTDKNMKGAETRAGAKRRVGCVMLGVALLLGGVIAGVMAYATPARAQVDMDRSKFYADPAKYKLFGCPNIAQARPVIVDKLAQLEALIAKAESAPGGGMIAELAYSDEYKANQGDLHNLDARARELNCPPPQPTRTAPSPVPRQRPRH